MLETMHEEKRLSGSFKDPSGFIYKNDGQIFRRINSCYLETYRKVRDSGLFQNLMQKNLLIDHDEVLDQGGEDAHAVLKPRIISFVSYPYEWCFSQLKDAALATLEIQRIAISMGFMLKDAHGFNIQFEGGHPILIDSLSFDPRDQTPWEAYGQFCESFLIPLALMGYRGQYLNDLLKSNLNGIPLKAGSELLPVRSRLSIPLLMHIHLPALGSAGSKPDNKSSMIKSEKSFSENSMLGLCMSLEKAIKSIKLPRSEAVGFDQNSQVYTNDSLYQVRKFIVSIMQASHPSMVYDLGGNTKEFSMLAADYCNLVVSLDSNPAHIEQLYQYCKENRITNILPLKMDLTNPSAAIGWELQERSSLFDRGECDLGLALSLIHRLCISANIPLDYVARFLSRISKRIVIDFVPEEDTRVQSILAYRKIIVTNYSPELFESAFKKHFEFIQTEKLANSSMIYYMERKE